MIYDLSDSLMGSGCLKMSDYCFLLERKEKEGGGMGEREKETGVGQSEEITKDFLVD